MTDSPFKLFIMPNAAPLKLVLSVILAPVCLMAADFHDHLGLQLSSLREQIKQSPTGALDLATGFGFTEVETAGAGSLSVVDFARELSARHLMVVSAHARYKTLRKNPAQAIADAKALGATYLICPWLPHAKTGLTKAAAHRAAADFNNWGAACLAAGLRFGWHPHGFEFVPDANGDTPFDIIARETNPDLVVFEMDVFWVFRAGQDPVKLLQKYPGRWRLMHVKDIRRGAGVGLPGDSASPADRVAVGAGQIDWPAVLAAARRAGVTDYFIEDEGGQPLRDIATSLKYLRALRASP